MGLQVPKRFKDLQSFLPIKKSLKYWDSLFAYLFEFPTRSYMRKDAVKHRIIQNRLKKIFDFEKKYGFFNPKKALIGCVTQEKEDIAITCDLLQYISQKITIPKLRADMSAEVLTKVLAFRNLDRGMEIPFDKKTYVVDRIFDLWNEMNAFGLIDKKGQTSPILLFRGTDFSFFTKGGRSSIITDFDPKGPGISLFHHAKLPIKNWIKTTSKKEKARVFGFSLGGALGAYALLSNLKYVSSDPNLPSYLFQPPGISSIFYTKWQELKPNEKPAIITYVARGDLVSKFGKLIGNTEELSTPSSLYPLIAHTTLYFLRPYVEAFPVELYAENQCRYRKQYSRLHHALSFIFYHLGLKHLLPSSY